jgi:RNA polymerase sigma-70 factor, ECF subfamily
VDGEIDIIEKMHSGNVEAFSALFRAHYEPLCYFASRFVGNFDAAEGIVQDVFVRLWEQRQTLEIHTSLKSYLYTAVKNASLNYLKRARVSTPLETAMDVSGSDASLPDVSLESKELLDALDTAINNLPPKCREIFRLAKLDGLSYQEIAELEQISVNTVKTQLQRALKTLSKALKYIQVVLILLRIAQASSHEHPVTLSDRPVVVDIGDGIYKEPL